MSVRPDPELDRDLASAAADIQREHVERARQWSGEHFDRAWAAAEPRPFPFEPIDWPEFWNQDHAGPQWLIEDVLAHGRDHIIWAKTGQKKSLFTLDMALKVIRAGSAVLYVDFEMTKADLEERLTDMGAGPDTDLSLLRYLQLPPWPALDTAQGGQAMSQALDRVQADVGDRHVLVVVDTAIRAVDGPENDSDTWSRYYRYTVSEIKRRGYTSLRLDHHGWESKHVRGSSEKTGHVDLEWRLELTDSGLRLKRGKARIGWASEHVTFRQVSEPRLTFEPAAGDWSPGTRETAKILDELRVPPEASVRTARAELVAHGQGRQNRIIGEAQKYRRWWKHEHGIGPVTHPVTLSADESGNAVGNAKSAPPETAPLWGGNAAGNAGNTDAASLGNTGGVYVSNTPVPDAMDWRDLIPDEEVVG